MSAVLGSSYRASVLTTSLALLLTALLAPAPALADDNDSWTGERIMIRRPGVRIGHTDPSGRQVFGVELTDVVYTVLDERDGWLLVQHRDAQDWVVKGEAIPLDDALSFFAERIRTQDRDAFAYAHRGRAWKEEGEPERALRDLNQAIRLEPNTAAWYANRGLVYDELGEYDAAIRDYGEAIRLDPGNATTYNYRGLAYKAVREYDRALRDYGEAIRLDPAWSDAYFNRANVYKAVKGYERAIRDYGEAIRLEPQSPDAYFNRANAYRARRDYARAAADYREVVRLDPEDADAHSSLAWLLATCPDAAVRDGKKAVEHATRACELTSWKASYPLASVAAAYAEAGNFDEAIKWQKRALESPRYEREEGPSARQRLALFDTRKPCREE
jgi:tetratricopeptide (TPR) repeat protein